MFKRLRWQIIIIELGAFIIITLMIIGAINVVSTQQINSAAHQMLELLAVYDGEIPTPETYRKKDMATMDEIDNEGNSESNSESSSSISTVSNYLIDLDGIDLGYGTLLTDSTKNSSVYFSVHLNEYGEVIDTDTSHVYGISEEQIKDFATTAFNSSDTEGSVETYRFLKTNNDSKTTIYFYDCSVRLYSLQYLTNTSIQIAALCLLFAAVFVWFFSNRAIKPLQENIEMEKRFITDASHELKTPLAAIQVNADVLELTTGKNETIDKIKRQTTHLSGLVNEMLTLARMDGSKPEKKNIESINLSALIENNIKEFEPIAQSQNKTLTSNIPENIKLKCERSGIEHLLSVLFDNAVKYCSDNGEINVTLTSTLYTTKFSISNTSEPLNNNDLEHLFDRFYRTDTSRSKATGGYGIGLSIAKAVVDRHHGKIYAKNADGCVVFTVEFS